jgi:hypothetical protein
VEKYLLVVPKKYTQIT